MVPLLAGATGKADVKPLTYVSALMALAGVGLLVEKGGVIMPNSGDAWSFASAVFFGIQVGSDGRAAVELIGSTCRGLAADHYRSSTAHVTALLKCSETLRKAWQTRISVSGCHAHAASFAICTRRAIFMTNLGSLCSVRLGWLTRRKVSKG